MSYQEGIAYVMAARNIIQPNPGMPSPSDLHCVFPTHLTRIALLNRYLIWHMRQIKRILVRSRASC